MASNIQDNLVIKNEFMTIQISSSDPANKAKNEEEAIKNGLSIIDFSNCENYLKDNGYIPKDEYIKYAKTDWNPAVSQKSVNTTSNASKSNSVTYNLYANNGTEIDMNLCANITTDVKMPIKNFANFNASNLTYNPFDTKSDYFNDICLPMKKNSTATTIKDRRDEFKGESLSCGGGCEVGDLNTTNGYVTCKCDTASSDDVFPQMASAVLNVFNDSNIFIAKCFSTCFNYVIYILII